MPSADLVSASFLEEALASPSGCRTDLTILLTPVKAQAFFCFGNIHSTGVNVNMEIAKFVLSCVGSFIAVSGFFMGIWKSYSRKLDDKIEKVKGETTIATDKLEKRIDSLEKSVSGLQKEVNSNLGERLSNIEGTMKKMANILTQIQNWFISNTPRS